MVENKAESTAVVTGPAGWRRWLTNRWLLGGLAALLVYVGAGFLLAPWLVERQLTALVEQRLHHRLTLEQVRVNPLVLTLEISGLGLQTLTGEPVLAFRRLLVDFKLVSLLRRAWTFAEISLENPALHLVIAADGDFNLAGLLANWPEPESDSEPAPESPPPRLLIEQIAVRDGIVHFSDYSGPEPVTTSLPLVNIGFHDFSTLPEQSGVHAVAAKLPSGGQLAWRGEASLVPLVLQGSVTLEDFRPGGVWDFFQDQIKLALPQGVVGLELAYNFSHAAGVSQLLVEPLDLTVRDLLLREPDGERPLLQLDILEIKGAGFDLARRELHIPQITMGRGGWSGVRDRDGRLNWQQLFPAALAEQAPASGDSAPPAAAGPAVIDTVATGPAVTAPEMAADSGNNGSRMAQADPPWRLTVADFRLDALALHYSDASRGAPFLLEVAQAGLSLGLTAQWGAAGPAVQVADLELGLAGVESREPAAADFLWQLAEARLAGGWLDSAGRQLGAGSLELSGGRAAVVQTAAGLIRQQEVYAAADSAAKVSDPGAPRLAAIGSAHMESESPSSVSQPAAPRDRLPVNLPIAETASAPAAAPWAVVLDRLQLHDFDLDYRHQGFTPALAYGLRGLTVALADIDTAGSAPVRVTLQAEVKQGGVLTGEASLPLSLAGAEGRLQVEHLNLTPLAPLLGRQLLLSLDSGTLSLDQRFTYRAEAAGPALQMAGTAGISDLLLRETESGVRFLSWQEMALQGVDFSLAPDRLHIAEIRLEQPEAKMVIFADGSVNLAQLQREKTGADPQSAAATEPQPLFPLRVDRVSVADGVVDFADLSLLIPFSARIEQFRGTALDIAAEPGSKASLEFDGQVGEYGEAVVAGALAPLDPTHFTDIRAIFRNVELVPLSPYTVTFAGRKVGSGRLDLDLEYKIVDRELLGDHQVVLRDFTLGERVESPDALRLPLDLAIALLKDRQGKIDIAVPVRGDLDSPEFSYGQVIWQAVRNLLTGIVTAPFRALGALFGGDAAEPDTVFFAPGQALPAPSEREKLHRVGEVMVARPQLSLTVSAAFSREADGENLRSLAVRRALAAELKAAPTPGEDPGPVAFAQAATQLALEELAGGSEPLAAWQAAYEAETGLEARRVNSLLARFGRASDDLEFYRALFQHLVASAPLAEEELLALAAARRAAVIRELSEVAGLEPERLLVGELVEVELAGQDRLVPVGLALGAR